MLVNQIIQERMETHRKHLTHAMNEIGEALTYYELTQKIDYEYLIKTTMLIIENSIILDEYKRIGL